MATAGALQMAVVIAHGPGFRVIGSSFGHLVAGLVQLWAGCRYLGWLRLHSLPRRIA